MRKDLNKKKKIGLQLPPISKNDDNHLLDHPHVFLDEIMRQAKESEIIQVSMQIRDGEPLKEFHLNLYQN